MAGVADEKSNGGTGSVAAVGRSLRRSAVDGLDQSTHPVQRLKRLVDRMANFVDDRRADVEVEAGVPSLLRLLSAGDRLIPYLDDLTLLRGVDGPFADRAFRRPALRLALARLPLVLAPCDSFAAALRPFTSSSTDLVVCRPAIADAYALAPFVDRAVALRTTGHGSRLEIAAFVGGGDVPPMERVAGLLASLRKDHGFEARAHLILTGGRETCPDDLLRRPGFVFHGAAPADRVREILIGAHLLLGASDGDRFADVPLEASHAGLPAVMPDRPVYREAFGGTAFHLDVAAPDVAGRIAALLNRPGLFQKAREAAEANLARWNAASGAERRNLLAGFRRAGLGTERMESAVPFLRSRVRT